MTTRHEPVDNDVREVCLLERELYTADMPQKRLLILPNKKHSCHLHGLPDGDKLVLLIAFVPLTLWPIAHSAGRLLDDADVVARHVKRGEQAGGHRCLGSGIR